MMTSRVDSQWCLTGWMLAILLILEGAGTAAHAISLVELQSLPNPQCVHFAIQGPCLCGGKVPGCVQLSYWEPAALVETVKVSGKTNITITASVISELLSQFGVVGELGGGGAGNTGAPGQTNLQFNEAHVFPFPQLLPGPCDGCIPEDLPEVLQVHYVSEIDPLWRLQPGLGVQDPLAWIGLGALGTWARLYPRVGFAIHGSEPVGSAIAASRALHIANQPVDARPLNPDNSALRPVITPSPVPPLCIQLARPMPTACFPVGTTPAFWETGTVSPRGEYIWLFWRYRSCCVDPATLLCGIANIGGTGENFCRLGPQP